MSKLGKAIKYAPDVARAFAAAWDSLAGAFDRMRERRRERAEADRAAHDAAVMDQLKRDKRRAADDAREREIMERYADIDRRKPR